MARIVHVGNFTINAKGAFQHGVEHKISNGLIRNGHQVIEFSDRHVARGYSKFQPPFGKKLSNSLLKRVCNNVQPDLLLVGHADIILPETIAEIRAAAPGLRVVQWNVDPITVTDCYRRTSSKVDVVDATLVSTAGEKALGGLRRPNHLVGFLPNPVDYSIERGENHLKADLPYDLFYACGDPTSKRNVLDEWWDMNEFLKRLQAGVPDLKMLTPGSLGQANVAGGRYQTALESAALGLNVSGLNNDFLYTSDRMAQMCGNGLALLVARSTSYDTLFSDDEMAFFDSFDSLIAQVERLAGDPVRRMAVAAAGRKRYHALFNEQVIARYITEVAFETIDPSKYEWPTLI